MASFGKFRFLTLIKPVLHILPEVAPPDRKIPFKARHSLAARSQCWALTERQQSKADVARVAVRTLDSTRPVRAGANFREGLNLERDSFNLDTA